MESKNYRKTFNEVAKSYGFENIFNAWFMQNEETIIVLDLQKSNYSPAYQLMIKTYIQGLFGKQYQKSKDLVRDTGDVFRVPVEYKEFFSLEYTNDDRELKEALDKVFKEFINPYLEVVMNLKVLSQHVKEGKIFMLPAVKEGLSGIVGEPYR